ncbi:MAG: hypothetical protein V1789_00820 [PVC group bacterium]
MSSGWVPGKNQLFRLNRDSSLVQSVILPMLEAEQKQFSLMRDDLARIMEGKCISGVLFGSTARGEETPSLKPKVIARPEAEAISV